MLKQILFQIKKTQGQTFTTTKTADVQTWSKHTALRCDIQVTISFLYHTRALPQPQDTQRKKESKIRRDKTGLGTFSQSVCHVFKKKTNMHHHHCKSHVGKLTFSSLTLSFVQWLFLLKGRARTFLVNSNRITLLDGPSRAWHPIKAPLLKLWGTAAYERGRRFTVIGGTWAGSFKTPKIKQNFLSTKGTLQRNLTRRWQYAWRASRAGMFF